MKVFRGIPNSASRAPCALTIGNFDGVHLGHQALLARVRHAADELGIEAAVMTFEPHPRAFFAQLAGDSSKAPSRLANLRDNLGSLKHCQVDRMIVEHFNAQFASLSPEQFIKQILVDGLQVRWLMVGEDFRFGAKRAGDIETLRRAGAEYGFTVETLETVTKEGVRISSSAIRDALAAGNFELAESALGHPYGISGHVIHGAKLGRTLGFPTLNLRIAHQRPALTGIFVVRIHGLAAHALQGVASLGHRPTVDNSHRYLLETHVFDYQGHAYGKIVRIEFLHKLRDEQKYPDLATLTAAIHGDAEQARAWFAAPERLATRSATDRI